MCIYFMYLIKYSEIYVWKNVQIFRKCQLRLARKPRLPTRRSRPSWVVTRLYYYRDNIIANMVLTGKEYINVWVKVDSSMYKKDFIYLFIFSTGRWFRIKQEYMVKKFNAWDLSSSPFFVLFQTFNASPSSSIFWRPNSQILILIHWECNLFYITN